MLSASIIVSDNEMIVALPIETLSVNEMDSEIACVVDLRYVEPFLSKISFLNKL